ncbi:MAG: acyl-ACP--UDP-N-acetylglucosamine O-acyltransferase [bacterium]|jgi:UDP-N-acetylglucosamine acyltransferase
MLIHRTAIVHPEAEIAPGVEVGAYSVIGRGCSIGAETKIDSHVVIQENTTIGNGCRIYSHAVIGTDPQDLKYKGQPTFCEIGDGTLIREFVTINRGSTEGSVTRVGSNAMLMTSVHIAHDCQIGDRVIMANLATLGGHCQIGEGSVIGGKAVAHQFVRVGKYAMVGGTSGLMQDVPPFMMAFGQAPAKIVNINAVGIMRNGYSKEDRANLRRCFHLLYRNGNSLAEALEKIEEEFKSGAPLELVQFFRESKRGTCRPVGRNTWVDSRLNNDAQPQEFREAEEDEFFDELTASLPAT